MSELTKRVLFGIPAAALFIFFTWLGGIYFTLLIVLISLFIQRETLIMCDNAGFKTDDYFPYTIGLWILLTPFLLHPLAIGLAIFLVFIAVQVFKPGDRGIKEMISTFFCGIYAPIGFMAFLMIRSFGENKTGFFIILSLLLMVWGNDVFAYFGGKAFGKHMLAPRVSPNKTWEGFYFGILGAVVGLALSIFVFSSNYPTSFFMMLPSVFLVSIFGPIGDLTESRIKRAAKVKDASDLLPGHGGVFDRFDALILAAPAFYLYLYWLQIMGYVSF